MRVVGKHTLEMFDRQNQLMDRRESYNLVTTKGRERILDIWAANFGPNGDHCGYQMIDTTPTVVAGGTRRCTMVGAGNMSNYNYNTYDGRIATNTTMAAFDALFTPGNKTVVDACGDWGGVDATLFHSVDMMRIDTVDEQYTVAYPGGNSDMTINLVGSNLKSDYASDRRNALMVQNSSKTTTYTCGSSSSGDFYYDRALGRLIIRYAGTIPNGTAIKITYKWHDASPFSDGVVGLRLVCWPWPTEESMHNHTWMGRGAFSCTGGETWEVGHWPWEGRPMEAYTTWNNPYRIMLGLSAAFSQSQHDRCWLTYPYVCNKPTNFRFDANFSHGQVSFQNFNFLKPVWHKMTPRVIAVGSGNTSPAEANTQLDNEIVRLDCLYIDRPSNGLGRWKAYIDYDECVGQTFREVGLFHGNEWRNSTAIGWTYVRPPVKTNCTELFCRTLYDEPVTKTNDMRMELKYELELS